MLKFKLPSYFKRLMLFGILLGTLPVALLGVFSYNKSASIVQDKVNRSSMQNLEQTQVRVEQSLKALQHSFIQFAGSKYMSDLIGKNLTYRDFIEINAISSSLTGLQTFETNIAEITLINLDKNWMVDRKGFSNFNNSLSKNELDRIMGKPGHFFWTTERQSMPERSLNEENPSYSGGSVIIGGANLIVKIPVTGNTPSGLLIASISTHEINKLILKTKQSGQFLVLDENYRVIASEEAEMIGRDISSLGYVKTLAGRVSPSGTFKSSIGGGQYSVGYIRSEYTDWTYVSVISIKDITSDSHAIGWLTLAICSIVMMIAGVISFIGSQKMYKPIHNLYVSILQEETEQNGKAGDEFSRMDDRVSSLRKSHSQLQGQIRIQLTQLKELFMMKLLHGKLHEEEIQEKVRALGLPEQWQWLCAMTVQIDSFEDTGYHENDGDLMMFAVNNIIEELVPQEHRFYSMLLDQFQVNLMYGCQEAQDDFVACVYALAENIQSTVKSYLKLKVSIGISFPFSELYKTQMAYEESVQALKYRVRFGEEVILRIGDVSPESRSVANYPRQLKDELMDAIRIADGEKAEELLEEVIKSIFKNEASIQQYQFLLNRLLMDILSEGESGGAPELLIKGSKTLFDELFMLKSTKEIKAWFMSVVVGPMIKTMEDKRGAHLKNIADEIIKMIQEKYDQDISLEYCAAQIGYHPGYVRRVLKKEYNISFSEYLAQYRLEIAKKWLRETDMTVNEVAERLRYNNSQNFIRYFRKLEGITPGQYRENKV